eukprot:4291938-Pleurochrysis_carterae.AAC.3
MLLDVPACVLLAFGLSSACIGIPATRFAARVRGAFVLVRPLCTRALDAEARADADADDDDDVKKREPTALQSRRCGGRLYERRRRKGRAAAQPAAAAAAQPDAAAAGPDADEENGRARLRWRALREGLLGQPSEGKRVCELASVLKLGGRSGLREGVGSTHPQKREAMERRHRSDRLFRQ